jgi:hypothetical protein
MTDSLSANLHDLFFILIHPPAVDCAVSSLHAARVADDVG